MKIRRSEGPARDRSEGNLLSRILKTAQETTNKNNQFCSDLNGLRRVGTEQKARSSEQERRVDARALIADEGRDKLR